MTSTLRYLPLTLAVALSAQAFMSTAAHAVDVLPGSPSTISYPPTPYSPNGSSFTYGPGYAVSKQSAVTLGYDMLGFLDTARITVSGPPSAHIDQDTDGYYTGVSFNGSSTANMVKLDDATGKVLGLNMLDGDITFTAPTLKSVSSGGSLTIHDLTVSLTDNLIYASVAGNNGLGSLSKVALFSYDHASLQVTKGPVAPPPCYPSGAPFCDNMSMTPEGTQAVNFSLNNAQLHLTQQGRDVFNQSLGLLTLGHAVTQSLSDFDADLGTVSLNATVDAVPGYFDGAVVVPEPGSMALMGLGLVGLIGLQRRRASNRGA